MAGRGRKTWARAALCAAALATPLAVSGCQSSTSAAGSGPAAVTGTSSSPAGGTSAASSTPGGGSSASSPAAATSSSTAPTALNATGGTGLTVSDGGDTVLMNGKAVDFGTQVNDPAWSPDGSRVVFIDGAGDLVVANADGSGRTVAAHNPGGEKWSHPTWRTTKAAEGLPARNNIFFASTVGGGTLWEVPTDAHDAKPTQLTLGGYPGRGNTPPPTSDNLWPSGTGSFGSAVYEHDNGSSADVYVRDDFLRQTGGIVIKNASEPDYVLVGTSAGNGGTPEVVFVRQVGAYKHVFVQTIQTSTGGGLVPARDLTPHATTDCTEPAVSPDGKTVAFSTSSGVVSVAADGSGNPAFVTHAPGFPAFRAAS